ncbi:hypothetical protein GCM10010123_26240 [Pilimelia anulata]|uniref:DUF4229 domain-containing protein n=1 Tax=Pilimelia anulata TaxID=53371 RepID=A0A8J3B870_9ACTN|nr:DUF4229 domain-containing protein [Pilimelia anulata]GGJ95198.1 hypothetical protein GCM10010123_26240 [Pilimelia anulata]
MSASVKYTLARLGLLVAITAALLPLGLNLFVTLLLAVAISGGLSYFLLRRLRDAMATSLAAGVERRRAQKADLRAALAGEEPPARAAAGDRP